MDRKINLNFQASNYVPKNMRAQTGSKYDNPNAGTAYNYDEGNSYKNKGNDVNQNYYQDYQQNYNQPNYDAGYSNTSNNYGNQQNYNDYYQDNANKGRKNNEQYSQSDKYGYNNQGETYTQQYNQGGDYYYGKNDYQNSKNYQVKDNYKKNDYQNYQEVDYGNKNNYKNQSSQNYQQNDYQNYNEYQDNKSYQQKDNYNNKNKEYNKGKNQYGNKNYQGGKDHSNTQNYEYNKDYSSTQNYQGGKDYSNTQKYQYNKDYSSTQNYQNNKDYSNIQNYQNHNKNSGYQKKGKNKNPPSYSDYSNYDQPKSKGQNYYVVEEDVTNKKRVNQQDLEDDMFDETFDISEKELGEDFEEDYTEDLYEDIGYTYDYGGKSDNQKSSYSNYTDTESKFSKMSLEDKAHSSSPNASQKHRLIFSNKDGFTNYVEELMKNEKKNSSSISDSFVNVLMIAEKPSIARSISEAIGGRANMKKLGKGGCIICFEGYFGNIRARFTVSSVMGHVYTSDFQREHNDWNSVDYLDLYDVAVAKIEANKKTRVPSTLSRLARGKDILCLWLDCDKEGENICYEVLYNCYPEMNKKHYQQIYRAKFSSLTNSDLKTAFNRMSERPNKFESLSVDARQVIDLKIGVSFTRFLTSAILPGIKGTDTKFLSYGPCQTPTLWFCVNRQNEINSFKSREYFRVFAEFEIAKIKYKVGYKKKFFDKNELNSLLAVLKEASTATVVNVITNKNKKEAPCGLNTVQMLRVASSYLKMSPHETMHTAEKLYTMGYVTYPRTETTKYAASFDFTKALNDFAGHATFGKSVSALLKNFKRPTLRGVDVGDHPPITPSRVAGPGDLKGDHWRLYEFICTNFFASLSESAEWEEKVVQLSINGEIFEADSLLLTKEGFLTFMPWKKSNYVKDFPVLCKDTVLSVLNISTDSNWTDPPEYLSESDLIKMMEHNKIGTDASMPVHIQNICERGYVKVDAGRRLIPTKLGKALIESLSAVDPEIVQPSIRAQIENYVDQVAKGNKSFEDVLSYAVELYKKKFLVVRQHYEKLLNSFKKYFDVDLMEMNKVYMSIKSKNEALKLQNRVRKEYYTIFII